MKPEQWAHVERVDVELPAARRRRVGRKPTGWQNPALSRTGWRSFLDRDGEQLTLAAKPCPALCVFQRLHVLLETPAIVAPCPIYPGVVSLLFSSDCQRVACMRLLSTIQPQYGQQAVAVLGASGLLNHSQNLLV